MPALQPGDPVPDVIFSLADGQSVRLADLLEQCVVVLFFYPKNGTAICTKEACAFRDAYQAFVDLGATVVGVSGDSAESHDRFAAEHRLPFPLVSDKDGALRRAFGASTAIGLVPGRVTFVIDRQGRIAHAFRGLFASDRHVAEALEKVRELAAGLSAISRRHSVEKGRSLRRDQ